MSIKNLLGACLFVAACAIVAPKARAQQPCQPPQPPPAVAGQNIFTPQQEMDLGDAIAEQLQKDFRVIDDSELNAYLRRVGERVASQAPDVGLRFQFFIFDLPEANAFTLPGGRIYVSRKLIALARTEDELAGVIAHEIGHGAARQMPVEMTRSFREIIGVTSVTDRRDIFDKYNRLVENEARKPGAFSEKKENKDQEVADQIGFYALVRAGYDPQAQASLWDRLTETKGKTGNFFSDLFGTTKPESKRLREMLKSVAQLPASCVQAHATSAPGEFQKWQAAVVGFTGGAAREAVHGVVSKTTLEPPLRGDITYLKFSLDGKYVLAQDDTGINVLTREPFAALFRIDAPEAYPAHFTPDSQSIVFHSPNLRVETWSIAEKKLTGAREMYVREGCWQTELAPDGKTLACLEPSTDLSLFDTSTGAQIFQKKSFFHPDLSDFLLLFFAAANAVNETKLDLDFVNMSFSPDGRYFVAGDRSVNFTGLGAGETETSAVAVDTTAPKTTLPLRNPLKRLLGGGKFTFLGADRVVAVDPQDYHKSAIVKFPEGETVEQFALTGKLEAATKGNYVILRPIQGYPAGVLDVATKKILLANKLAAIDVWDQFYVAERTNGELGLYRVQSTERVGVVVLPRDPLGILRAAAVSPDFKWLAVSERSRGAVWDLTKGERVMHVRGFRGAYFGGDGSLYADFPKFEGTQRTIAKVDLASRGASENFKLEEKIPATQYGSIILVAKSAGRGDEKGMSLEARDSRTGASLWTKEFPKESPRYWASEGEGTLVLAWASASRTAKDEIKADQRLAQQLAVMREKEGDYFLEVLDARTGSLTGKLLIETGKGSFRIRNVEAAGDFVVITDTENRVLVYTLSTGEQRGRFFGDHATLTKASGLLAVENERGQLSLYDLSTAEKRDAYTFPAAVSLAHFSDDGKRLFVLTANQTVYVLDTSGKKE
jgi:WD40 repeat protein